MPGPVRHLAFLAAVGDRGTLGALLGAVSALVTHHTGQEFPEYLGHLEASLFGSNANFAVICRALLESETDTSSSMR